MQMENRVRPDLWKAICAHYERQDYTEAVRDSLLYVCELLREKSGLENVDGTKLINDTLLGSNPSILVNRNETTTEKDIQQGVGFCFKGLMQAIRNPLSHENTTYSQNDAEAIILFINYLLSQVDHSGGYSKIESINNLLFDKDFTPTEEYAELLLKEVPTKKRYDLLVELFHKRTKLPQHTLTNFISKLYASLSKTSKSDFLRLVSSALMTCKNDSDLRMYLHYFMTDTYRGIERLAQLRIEAFILRSIREGTMEKVYNTITQETEEECNNEGTLATWICDVDKFGLLTNKDSLKDELISKLALQEEGKLSYVFEYFDQIAISDPDAMTEKQIRTINMCLKSGNERLHDALSVQIEFLRDKTYCRLFGESFSKCEEIMAQREEMQLPF